MTVLLQRRESQSFASKTKKWSVCDGRRGLLKILYIKSRGRRDKEKEEKMEDPQAGLGSLQPWQVGRCLEKEL